MTPEIYFEGAIRPEIRVKLLPGETAESLDTVQTEPIKTARKFLSRKFPKYKAAQQQLSNVIGSEGADKLIDAYRKGESFSLKYSPVKSVDTSSF